MLNTIRGIYDNGQIVLNEIPPIKKANILVTFLTDEEQNPGPAKRKLGGLEGQVPLPADFNEPLDDLKDYM